MKVTRHAVIYFVWLIFGLSCFQLTCSARRFSSVNLPVDTTVSLEQPQQQPYPQEEGGLDVSDERILQEASGYTLVKHWQDNDNSYHYVAAYKGVRDDYRTSTIIKNLHMIVSFHDTTTFRIKILDNDNTRWEIPEQIPFPHFKSNTMISLDQGVCTIEVQEDPFSLVITRKDTGEVLFDTRNRNFIYSDLYIEFSTALPTENVYGFGERNYKFKLAPGTFTIWGRDDPMILEDGNGGANTYSHHPVGLIRDKKGNFFLTLMRNSNAMDVIVEKDPALTYKMVGGVIDLVFFIGDDYPETVLKAYHNYLGNFTMMPFWSMGYHQSKWGYMNHGLMHDVVTKYIEHDIPLDVIWSDIDYMIDKEIFTVDTYRYPPEQMKELTTKYKKKWVPIIDPGVRLINPRGPGLKTGLERDVFLKNNRGQDLVGSVWPGRVHFPDFFHPNTEQYWCDMLDVTYQTIPFAGIWLDMNEVANFVDGEDNRWDRNIYDTIPYVPGKRPLKRKTISMDAVHYGGAKEYDTHALFSIMENAATHKFLQSKSKLPFILTRSTSVGLGRYSAHWSGDNGAHWEYLKVSIPGNFNFQIFGIPFVGADICGFMDDTNEELCARWTQLGALYPFARNHHEDRTRNQEPWTFNGQNRGVSVLETTRIALKTRYSVLKWYYSLFIATQGAGSIFKPLLFEFPHEEALYNDGFTDSQFLLGKSVLCTPKVEPGEPIVDAYFPIANWFNLFTGERVMHKDDNERIQKVETPFDAPVPHFLRGGHIVHRQKVEHVLSTEDLNDEFELIVALDRETENDVLGAKGSIMGVQTFDDNTIYYRCMEDNCLYDVIVTVPREDPTSTSIEVQFKRQSQDTKAPLDEVGIYGLRLYGLPLEFMFEDEKKLGFAVMQLTKDNDEVIVVPDIKKVIALEEGAFWIDFGKVIRVQDGDTLEIELLI